MAKAPPGAESVKAPPRTKKAARALGYANHPDSYWDARGTRPS